jgi:hypothetical protein
VNDVYNSYIVQPIDRPWCLNVSGGLPQGTSPAGHSVRCGSFGAECTESLNGRTTCYEVARRPARLAMEVWT